MIEVHREPDDVSVSISNEEVDILDGADDYILAECKLTDLADEASQPFPKELTIQIQ